MLTWPRDTQIEVRAPLVQERKGEFRELFERVRKQGFIRAYVDGELIEVADPPKLNRRQNHTISVVVDRLVVRAEDRGASHRLDRDGAQARRRARRSQSAPTTGAVELFSEQYGCPVCGISLPELEPRHFSFNSPFGACPTCGGLGTRRRVSEELILGDPRISILEGVDPPVGRAERLSAQGHAAGARAAVQVRSQHAVGRSPEVACATRFCDGDGAASGRRQKARSSGKACSRNIERRYDESDSDTVRIELEEYMIAVPCDACGGRRLKPESLAVTIDGQQHRRRSSSMPVTEALHVLRERFRFGEDGKPGLDPEIAGPILKEVRERLRFLVDVGLDYLTLGRSAESLSGGEAQRIRLATQIGSRLVGVLYILDEPSIGLHQRDNARLLATLEQLRDLGNTVIVVEHDEETMRAADHVIDLGPGAGKHGGEVIADGHGRRDHRAIPHRSPGKYLERRDGDRDAADAPAARRASRDSRSRARASTTCATLDVEIPLGLFVAVTGVSGSGKSTLIEDILHRALARHFYRARVIPGAHDRITGFEHIDKVIDIDQSPDRPHAALESGDVHRPLHADPRAVRRAARGEDPRLRAGTLLVQREGRPLRGVSGRRPREDRDALPARRLRAVRGVQGKALQPRDARGALPRPEHRRRARADGGGRAATFFENQPRIHQKLETLTDVGLGYIHLGQSATTLSGGEAQRVKLATELSKRDTGRTFYILDEPTTGLHFEDVRVLLDVLHRLVDRGNTVLVIEHNLDVIKTADWIIDLGPEGGTRGGTIVAAGTPEEVAAGRRRRTPGNI